MSAESSTVTTGPREALPFPHDIWLYLLSFLPNISIARAAQVCRESSQLTWQAIVHLSYIDEEDRDKGKIAFAALCKNRSVTKIKSLEFHAFERDNEDPEHLGREILKRCTQLEALQSNTVLASMPLLLPEIGSRLKSFSISSLDEPLDMAANEQVARVLVRSCPHLEVLQFLHQPISPECTRAIGEGCYKLRELSLCTTDWSGLKPLTQLQKLIIKGNHLKYHDHREAKKAIELQRAMNPPQLGFRAHFYDSGIEDSGSSVQSLIVSAIKSAPDATVKYILGELSPAEVNMPTLREYTELTEASTLLHCAINSANNLAVMLLLEMGADPMIKETSTDETCFNTILRTWSRDEDTVALFFDKLLPECLAKIGPKADVRQLLRSQGVSIFTDFTYNHYYHSTDPYDAPQEPSEIALKRLSFIMDNPKRIALLQVDMDERSDSDGCTAMHKVPDPAMAKNLLERGAMWDILDNEGHNAIQCLSRESAGKGDVVSAILSHLGPEDFVKEAKFLPFANIVGFRDSEVTKTVLERFLELVPLERWDRHFLKVIHCLGRTSRRTFDSLETLIAYTKSDPYTRVIVEALATDFDTAPYYKHFKKWYSWVVAKPSFQLPLYHAVIKAGNDVFLRKAFEVICQVKFQDDRAKFREYMLETFVTRDTKKNMVEFFLTYPTSGRTLESKSLRAVFHDFGFVDSK